MDRLFTECVLWMQQHCYAESLTIWMFLLCAATILIAFKKYGAYGLYVYNSMAIVLANIQVLRVAQYATVTEPVALGTVLFTTTFFVNDLLTEHYGLEYAHKSVMLGFWTQIFVTIIMLLTLGHPLPTLDPNNSMLVDTNNNYQAMLQIFSPSLRVLLASLIAYVCSQLLDILIFNRIRDLTNGKYLWLRQNIAMFASGTFDTCLFSFLAWMVFSDTKISYSELFIVYIFSAQAMRFILNISFTPLMYLSYYCVPNKISIFDLKKRPASS